MSELMVEAVSVVTLGVSDMQRARRYYASIFADDGAPSGTGPHYFRLRGTWLALYPRDALAAYFGVPAAGSGFSGATVSVNVHEPEEVDSLCQRLCSAGGRLTVAPGPAAWGGRVACLADADGHMLELVWNPAFAKRRGSLNPGPA